MTELKGCPVCNAKPKLTELVDGKVWHMACPAGSVLHAFSVMSWTSAEHCEKLWNTRHEDKE